MADNKTIKKNADRVSSQAFYTKAVHDHGADIAYSFISRDDSKYITRKALEEVGIYYGKNNMILPKEFNSQWIMKGYNIGERKLKYNLIDEEDIDEIELSETQKLKIIKEYLKIHDKSFSKDEEDLINVGVYYSRNGMKLPKELNNVLIMFGYYNIPMDIIFNDDNSHKRK